MHLPSSIALGAHTFTPRSPGIGARIAFFRAYQDAPDAVAQADTALAALHLAHPSPPWTVPAGASVLDIGIAVAAWCDANGVGTVEAWNAADSIAAPILRSVAPPMASEVATASGNSAAPAGTGSDGASSSPGTTSGTDGVGST